MNCDFINNLTTEQKAELRKLLDEETQPKYKVKVELWDNGNIKFLKEYLGDKLHGKTIWWHENGQKELDIDYHLGQPHGKTIGWHKNGQKQREDDYYQGKLHGKSIWWYENGQKSYEADFHQGKLTKEYPV